MSKASSYFRILACFLGFLITSFLVACNMPRAATTQANIDVTQAYQTVQARLTSLVGQTPVLTISPDEAEAGQTASPSSQVDATPTITENAPLLTTGTTAIQVTTSSCDQAAAGYPRIDITVEDDTEMAPGEAFTKVWRVENVGTCTWAADYSLVFFSGEIMGASPSQPLEGIVSPNQSVDLSVSMVAPSQAGTYQGNWKLRNAAGEMFGIGPSGESPFWVRIKVMTAATETSTPTPSPTPTTEAQASGSASMAINDGLDLDTLLLNSGGPDLRYRTTLVDPRHQLVPLIGAAISIFGTTQPGLSDCQAATLGNVPITLDELPVGTYLCHRTDLGLPGWTRFDGFNTDTGAITLQVLTWKVP